MKRSADERAHVNALVKAIQKNSPRVYIYIDRDAGSIRHTSSGFDFILAADSTVVFCEAKESKGSDWQEFVKAQITAARVKYCVVRFFEDGERFSLNGEKVLAISEARFSNFI